MTRINKMDHYAGAFITSLLNSATGKPALFDETSDSRRLQIDTNMGSFNIYVKYTANPRKTHVRERDKTSWFVNFTDADMRRLEAGFVKENYKNYIALILSDKSLTKTKIAVIDYKDAMNCLTKTTQGGTRRINVVRYGNDHKFICYGAAERESEGVKVYVNHMRYFDKTMDGERDDLE